ncbi:MAG: hypothetical protein AAB693_01550 [Patescibacteria group bacterium]
MKKFFIFNFLFLVIFLFSANFVLGTDKVTDQGVPIVHVTDQGVPPAEQTTIPIKINNPLRDVANTIPAFIQIILEGAIKIGMPVVALAIIYCGFLFVAARGNETEITAAKNAFLWTVIGGAVLLGSWALAQMIASTVDQFGILSIVGSQS